MLIWIATCLMAAIALKADRLDSWVFKASLDDDRFSTLFCLCLYRAVYICSCVGYGAMGSRVFLDHIVDFICMTIGAVLYVFWLAELLQILNINTYTLMKYEDLRKQVREYLNFKELPAGMTKKFKEYYSFRYNYKLYGEQKIMYSVSPRLRQVF